MWSEVFFLNTSFFILFEYFFKLSTFSMFFKCIDSDIFLKKILFKNKIKNHVTVL